MDNNQYYPQDPQQPNYQQPNYQQPNYQQQPQIYPPQGMQYPAMGGQQMPKTWLTESVVITALSATICCNIISLILGIIGIVKANSVKNKFMQGDFAGAESDSNSAKIMVIIGGILVAISAIFSIIYLVIVLGAGGAAALGL